MHNISSPKFDFATRNERLLQRLKELDCSAILITDEINVRYLTGFTGDSTYLLVTPEDKYIISDFRYIQQIDEECDGFTVIIRGRDESMVEALEKLVTTTGLKKLAIEADALSVANFRGFAEKLPNVEFVDTNALVMRLREVKDDAEVALIRRAVRIAEKTMEVLRARIHGDMSELQCAGLIDQTIRSLGGEGCSFTPIVGVGMRGALPHAVLTSHRVEESDFVLVDWGARYEGYVSDLTRVLAIGSVSPKLAEIHAIVKEANERAIAKIAPGVRMMDVDAAARDFITEAGYGDKFGHSLGHGIGLQVHEQPRLRVNDERLLEPGMVVTVEPGIYLPEWGGVRLEDDVLVTETGCEVISRFPKDLSACTVD